MNIVKYSLDNSKVIYFFLAVMLLGGIFSFDKLGKKEDAPFVIKQAMLMVSYPGSTALEMEQLVTEVIERELQTMPNIYRIKSDSYSGMAKISVELQPYTPSDDILEMWDVLRRKVLNVQQQLPQGVTINVNDDFGDVFGLYYGLVADDGFTDEELRVQAMEIKRRLSVLEGVQQVTISGIQRAAINVNISLSRLAGLGIAPDAIVQTIASQNRLVSPGDKLTGPMQMQLYADGTYRTLRDIRNQIISTPAGQQIRLGDIAEIERGYIEPPTTIVRIDGKHALGIAVSSPKDKDVVKTSDEVEQVLSQIRRDMPVGMELVPLYSEGQIAREANNGFLLNLVESVVIVILILMFVMGFKASVLIGSSLIFSISGTLLIMQWMGVGLNRTSLAGFIIAMGMLVDNAIVVTDNAQVNMKRGMNKRKAIIAGADVPMWGLAGATLIAIFSFLPLYMAKASVAEIVQPLFVVIGVSLGLSWILALTQTTTFASFMFKEPKPGDYKDPYDKPFYRTFERWLRGLLAHRWGTVITMIAIFMASMTIMGMMPQNFFPALDKEYFRADLFFPNGYNIRQVEREMSAVENWLSAQPSVRRISVTMGSGAPRYYLATASFGPQPNYANILIEMHDKDSTAAMEDRFNTYIRENYPAVDVKSTLFKVSPQPDATIEIGFSGDNIDTLVMLSNKVQDIMRRCDLVDQVRNSWGARVPVLKPNFSQEKGQRLAVSRQQMAQSLAIATRGAGLGEFREGDQSIPILLRDINAGDFDLSDIKSLPVFTVTGQVLPLSQVTDDIKYEYDYYDIRRLNRERVMYAQCEPKRGANTMEAFNRILAQVKEQIDIPDGYDLRIMGERDSQEQSNKALGENMPLVFVLIFIVLLLLFRAFRKPLVILAMVPLIFIGVVFGLLALGKMFDFFCLLGLLGLIGMNIKNAIVLVDQIGIEQEKGSTPYEAVVAATKSRLVPVAMASGTTILGMLPLLPDAMFGGMAATIMGGLLVATFLTVFILPVTYSLVFRIKTPKR